VEEAAQRITRERNAFRADQFQRAGSFRAHYLHTGPELWSQSGGTVSAFCDFVGTGGNFAGVTRYLKEQDESIQCFVVEPEGAAAAAGELVSRPDHPIQGGGYAMPALPFLLDLPVDGYLQVSGEEARHCARCLAREEGIFAGYSSGANLAAALKLLDGPLPGHTIAIMICDSGLKYLSTDLWT
jgi:cysteine synthase A